MHAGDGTRRTSRAAIALATASLVATTIAAIPSHATPAPRAWLGGLDGGVFTLGSAPFRGSGGGAPLASAYIAIAGRPSGNGYWLATLAGDVFPFGDAPSLGNLHGKRLNQPVVDMVTTPSGNGYWLVAADGGIFTFGDARFRGSLGGHPLNKPIAGMVPTPTGNGYWLVAADGGVFTFGDARFRGSLGGTRLSSPVAAMAATSDGGGYWLLQRDGDVTPFGNAAHLASATGVNAVAVGIVPTNSGTGYWVAFANGVVRAVGAASNIHPAPFNTRYPMIGIATPAASSSGYALTFIDFIFAVSAPKPPSPTWVGSHQVALTFDDGPGEYTTSVLDVLRRYGVPATFFTVGYLDAARPDLLQAEANAGMSVENHTWNHADMTRLSAAEIDQQLNSTSDAIQHAIGIRPKCFRPPYGATNTTVANEAARLGLTQILWNVDPSDYTRPGAGVIASRILSEANGRGLVIGIHDGGGDRSQTVAALPSVIEGLRSRGYSFVRLCT